MYKGLNIKLTEYRILLVFAALLTGFQASGQIAVSMQPAYACEGSVLHVPVSVNNFQQVSSFTLYLQSSNANHLELIEVSGGHQSLNGGTLLTNVSEMNGEQFLIVTWSRLSPVSIASGVLFEVMCYFNEGQAGILFSDQSEISVGIEPYENVVYTNGFINPLAPQPLDQLVGEDEDAIFQISAFEDAVFQWQTLESDNWTDVIDNSRFSGATTHRLLINDVTQDMDNTFYRCLVMLADCTQETESAELRVSPLSAGKQSFDHTPVIVYPNPFDEALYYQSVSSGNFAVSLTDLSGKRIYEQAFSPFSSGETRMINVSNLNPGLYFFVLQPEGKLPYTVKTVKR